MEAAEEGFQALGFDVLEKLLRRALLGDAALVHEDDAVGRPRERRAISWVTTSMVMPLFGQVAA